MGGCSDDYRDRSTSTLKLKLLIDADYNLGLASLLIFATSALLYFDLFLVL